MPTSSEFQGSGQNMPVMTSNFSQTCTLLSQYMKQNGGFGDLGLGMAVAEKRKLPESADMTIFYAGQVVVFNDFPADKANQIIKMLSEKRALSPASPSIPVSQRHAQPILSDLPIARKASLTRFLEKRKDRNSGKAPYQASTEIPSDESKAWLGLAAQSPMEFQA